MSEDGLSDWLTGYVMSTSGPFHFVVVIEKGISAVVFRETAISYGIRMGDFLKVKIKRNPAAQPKFRAQHYVIEFEKMNPLAETRLEQGVKMIDVIMTTTAQISSRTEFNRKPIWKLENNTFGKFIDLDAKIPGNKAIGTFVEFEFKCKASPVDAHKSIFVPTKIIGYGISPSTERSSPVQRAPSRARPRSRSRSVGAPRRVTGYVGHKQERFYWVWCKEFTEDVMMHAAHAVPNVDMIGKWISMLVEKGPRNGRASTCTVVDLIDDVCESRLKNNVPELCVKCTYYGESDDGYPVFHSEVVGSIVDVDGMVCDLEDSNTYRVWIARHKWERTISRWKVSPKQDLAYPLDKDGIPRKSSTQPGRLSRSRAGSTRSLRESAYTAAVGNDYHRVRSRDSSLDLTDDEANVYSDEENFLDHRKRDTRSRNGVETVNGEERNGVKDYKVFDDRKDDPTPRRDPNLFSDEIEVKRSPIEEEWKLRPSEIDRKGTRRQENDLMNSMSFSSLNVSGNNTSAKGSTSPEENYGPSSSRSYDIPRSRQDLQSRPASSIPQNGNASSMSNPVISSPQAERENRRTRMMIQDFMKSKEVRMAMKSHNAELYDELVGILLSHK